MKNLERQIKDSEAKREEVDRKLMYDKNVFAA